MNKITELISQKGNRRNAVIFAVGILLMVILMISEFVPEREEDSNFYEISVSVDEIEQSMSEKLEEIIKTLDGIDNVKVNVTLESTDEYIYAGNTDKNESENEKSVNTEYIYSENDDDGICGLIVSVNAPEVKGVAVICTGGDNAVVKNEIIKLVSSLYSIGTNRIYVGNYKE